MTAQSRPTAAPPAGEAAGPAGPATSIWLPVIAGVVSVVVGVLLLVRPSHGLAFVAVVAGCYLILIGILQLARAFLVPDLLRAQRSLLAGIGALALVAGVVVLARPEGTVKGVAIAAGLYLIVSGCAAAVSAVRNQGTRVLDALRAAIDVIAGLALVAWPGETVAIIAAMLGIYLIARGVIEIFFTVMLRNE